MVHYAMIEWAFKYQMPYMRVQQCEHVLPHQIYKKLHYGINHSAPKRLNIPFP